MGNSIVSLIKRFKCFLGFHKWQWAVWHESGARRKLCIVCGKKEYWGKTAIYRNAVKGVN